MRIGIGFLLFAFAEMVVIVLVDGQIGTRWTLLLMVLLSLLGAWVVRHEGLGAWQRIVADLAAGRMPTAAIVDAFLVLASGLLLLAPGFISGAIGLLLAIPPIRAQARKLGLVVANRRIASAVRVVGQSGGRTVGGSTGRFTWFTMASTDGVGGTLFDTTATSDDEPQSSLAADDVLDLDAEEVYLDGPMGELEPPTNDTST